MGAVRRKPSMRLGQSHLHPVQFGQGLANRQRRVTQPTKHYQTYVQPKPKAPY